MIRVLIADDQALIRAGFAALINSAPDLEVVGEALAWVLCGGEVSATPAEAAGAEASHVVTEEEHVVIDADAGLA